MSALRIHAGPTARARLLEEGLHSELFAAMVGASGGPKWFVLHGLDQYLFGEFFTSRERPLYTLGSSAGAWRICCMAMDDPVAAIDRLAEFYSQERYSSNPDTAEVTEQARVMLNRVLGKTGPGEIARNTRFVTHIVSARCRGMQNDAGKLHQALHLAASAALNSFNRRSLNLFFERTVFTPAGTDSPWYSVTDLQTHFVPLREDNVFDAMIASGSIPFVLEGVTDIAGAKPGVYWDGGITDYHFDLPFHKGEDLVLYPHFHGRVIPGWFDKHLAWRHAHSGNYHNVVLLAPSPEFVASLPNGKLSDRSDFKHFDYAQRRKIFQEVLARGQELAEEFANLIENGINPGQIHPIGNVA